MPLLARWAGLPRMAPSWRTRFRDASAPPAVLIMGLTTQMIAWPDELCEGLARCGLFVVRFGNRDVGGSTHLR